jgi:hypothetical protein
LVGGTRTIAGGIYFQLMYLRIGSVSAERLPNALPSKVLTLGVIINIIIMAELKRYKSFEALKLDEKSGTTDRSKNNILSEFEAFLKRLQTEYSNKKKRKTNNGKQLN